MKPSSEPWHHRRLFAALMLGSVLLLGACQAKTEGSAGAEVAPVVSVDVVRAESHAIQSVLAGRIVAKHTAEVRARVTGLIEKRLFTEGSDVAAGQVLFRVDARPFRAAVAKARGELASAEAAARLATAKVNRYKPLVEQDAVSQMTFDQAIADQKSAQAQRDAVRAALQLAQLDLDHATVRAPIAGRIGYALVSEGGLVSQATATPLALIQSIDSVYVDLVQSAASASVLAGGGSGSKAAAKKATVRLHIDEASGPAIEGEMMFEDITVDPDTAQVRSRALLKNPGHRLLPGMYVRATVVSGTDDKALFVSQKALRFSNDGSTRVQEVDKDNVLRIRSVVLGAMKSTQWQVLSGVSDNARIVSNYADHLSDGMVVNPQSASNTGSESEHDSMVTTTSTETSDL